MDRVDRRPRPILEAKRTRRKRIDEVVRLNGDETTKLLGISWIEADAVFEAKDCGALARELHGLLQEVNGRDMRSRPGEVDGVGADTASDFQDALATPALELRKTRDVVFDKIFTRFHLVEIVPGTDGRGGMTKVAGARVPVVPNAADFNVGEGHKEQYIRSAREG